MINLIKETYCMKIPTFELLKIKLCIMLPSLTFSWFFRLQTECDHYRMVAEEAYRHLMDIQDRDILSQSLNVRLRDWLELMEEIKNKVCENGSSLYRI